MRSILHHVQIHSELIMAASSGCYCLSLGSPQWSISDFPISVTLSLVWAAYNRLINIQIPNRPRQIPRLGSYPYDVGKIDWRTLFKENHIWLSVWLTIPNIEAIARDFVVLKLT